MATRNWSNQNQDWDPMRDDYNDSTFEPQYPMTMLGVQLDQCRLYIKNIPKALTEEGLKTVFAKYGTLKEAFLSKDQQKRYGLVSYETSGEAKLAMMKLNRTDPLKLNIYIAHRKKTERTSRDTNERGFNKFSRDDSASVSSRGRSSRKHEDVVNGDGDMEDLVVDEDLGLTDSLDPELHLELVQLKMEHLKLQEAQLQCKQRMLLLNRAGKKPVSQGSSNRCILPNGRIVVRNISDRAIEGQDTDISIGGGDSNEKRKCTCTKSWDGSGSSDDDSSSASTCVICEERNEINRTWMIQDKSDLTSKFTDLNREINSKVTVTNSAVYNNVDLTSKESKDLESVNKIFHFTNESESEKADNDKECGALYDFKLNNFISNSDGEHDETNHLIQLRNTDHLDIVEEHLKIVIALDGYPKSKMRLKQMEKFQKSLTAIIDMQLKAGLMKKVPSFLDYYLNRGAIVCICKDLDTRDWLVRVSAGLEERMNNRLIFLKSKVKRICLAMLKIPQGGWPATALDVFKLLQYFNPTLKTARWKIYAQKHVDDVEYTSFLIDRVSAEIIRGPTFKNVIDYSNMDFELTGYTEIYYESFLTDFRDDLRSVASRVKLLEQLRTEAITPRNDSTYIKVITDTCIRNSEDEEVYTETKEELENAVLDKSDFIKNLKDVEHANVINNTIASSRITNDDASDQGYEKDQDVELDEDTRSKDETTSDAFTKTTESIAGSYQNLIDRNSSVTTESNRGVAYNRRTNYLYVDSELKIAITLEGYPQNKLEGAHIRRLKRLLKEYLHKDIKSRRFTNFTVPKFEDIYLSNGAVIYICDSLETKDYLTAALPKFIASTGLKLTFKDVNNLVRYTRVVMRLPKELAYVESEEIISKLQAKYPSLKPHCWKYYSDVAGKQKRQYGVDPKSAEIIKSPQFDFRYEGQVISFRVIDRKRKDASFNEIAESKSVLVDDTVTEALWERISKEMYCPIDSTTMNASVTFLRTNHYSDIVADDLKLYVGPSNYPETRVDEVLFLMVKKTINSIVLDSVKNDLIGEIIPKIHDIYLYDGVIFIICKDVSSKKWMEDHIPAINSKLRLNLISTEFRGAVGIVSMAVNTEKDTDEVISMLQKQNPRLRTKYWRKINIDRSKTKLDVILQIDKLSAQLITSSDFNKFIGSNAVEFKLGHLKSVIKTKANLESLDRDRNDVQKNSLDTSNQFKTMTAVSKSTENVQGISDKEIPQFGLCIESDKTIPNEKPKTEEDTLEIDSTIGLESHKTVTDLVSIEKSNEAYCRMILKVPRNILPEDKDDFNVILDLLENKNPDLNTELWKIYYDHNYPGKGRFTVLIDEQSASVIRSEAFDSTIGGEKLKFMF